MTPDNEREWVRRAKQGDTAAFGELVRQRQTAVFNVAYRMFGRREDAEDAAQEAFLRAYKALDRFDETRPFTPWIKRITVNLCLNWLEAEKVRPQISAADMGAAGEDAPDMDAWSHKTPTPEQTMVRQEQSVKLRQAILQLPPRYRAVIECRHFQEMRYDEMAELLARPLSSVKSDLFRARKMLKEMLEIGD
ncbi:MAG TPA: sigma-70 family RNA polymerase sigma factor [Anaerolineae bacterium]|nr:sigma-70 family RNA polymerase sigma factor [Anaerolineae bacterium]HIP73125.1 sigma-70 family RNA polymerase sigma factor [Anaerolineae bacterium]